MNASPRTIGWGIIGCGDVTEKKSGPGFQKARSSRLVAVMRRNAERAQDYAKRHGVPRWYDDAQALIQDPEVDAVYVATPPSSHREYTVLAARAGKPVYVEKPMAMSFAECEEMIAACRKAGVPLFVAFYRRALEKFLKVKQLLLDGAIGEPRLVRLTFCQQPTAEEVAGDLPWRVMPQISGGGRVVDLGSHMLDLLDDLLGPIASARGSAGNQGGYFEAEDTVTASFTFESGVQGVGSWCFVGPEWTDLTEIVGTKGRVGYSTFDAKPVRLTTGDETQEFAIPFPPHVQQPLIQMVVDTLNGEGACPSTGESGARTSRVIDAILEEYRARSR
jgi:1,5-anhydro-D-fructose reductase (1,5-anhydro-D-mannitol-forming)